MSASNDLNHSLHVRHLVAVPQPDDPDVMLCSDTSPHMPHERVDAWCPGVTVGTPIVTEDELREASEAAIDQILAELGVTANDETRDVLVAAWLDGSLWGTIRARQHIEAMA